MTWRIIADTSADPIYGDLNEGDISVSYVPFTINTDTKNYVDDGNIDITAMVEDMYASSNPCKTACPASGLWLEEFNKADYSIAITISSHLSGSYQSACIARDMFNADNANKKAIVLDSCSAGPELTLGVIKAIELIKQGLSLDEIEVKLNEFFLSTHTLFALCSFENLIKNGRMSRIAGFVAKTLKMWGLGVGTDDGVIDIKGKARTESKIVEMIIDTMTENNFDNGIVGISHCLNEKIANKIKEAILIKWPNSKIQIGDTRGLCSFYAEKEGVIVAYY